ncbi:MAG: GAF domain-containing protein [Anaerolineae bacterium]|nr:GAF domain-containing protein [Anaerolineae bacterium]
MHAWVERLAQAQHALCTARTAEDVFLALDDTLRWLFGPGPQIDIVRETKPLKPHPVASEAIAESGLRLSPDGTQAVIPMLAEEQAFGLVSIRGSRTLEEKDVGIAALLVGRASGRLAHLAWPADPYVFRGLVENANVAIDVVNTEGKLIYANQAAAHLYGFASPADMLDTAIRERYTPEEKERVSVRHLPATQRNAGWIEDATHRHIDGAPLPVRLAVFGLPDARGNLMGYGAIVQNLSEQQRLLISLQENSRRLQAAAEVARAAVSKPDLDSLLRHVAAVVQRYLAFDIVSLALREGDALVMRAAHGASGPLDLPPVRLPLSHASLNTWAVSNAQPVLCNDVAADPRYQPVPELAQVAAELVVPLRLGDRIIGTLDLESFRPNTFHADDIPILQGIADQVAGAVENVMLFTAERTRLRQLEALNAISHLLVGTVDLDTVWPELHRQIAHLFDVSTFFVSSYDAATRMLSFRYLVVEGDVIRSEPPYLLTGLSARVIRDNAPLNFPDLPAQADALRADGAEPLPIAGQGIVRAWMAAPLRGPDGAPVGLLSVQSHRANAFDERDLQLLATIATQVSVVMENARLMHELRGAAEQLEARARRIESLYRLGALMATSLDRGQVFAQAAEEVGHVFGADHCGITLLDSSSGEVALVADHPPGLLGPLALPLEGDPVVEANRRGEVFLSEDVENDARLAGRRGALRELGIRAILAVPLASNKRWIGQLGLDFLHEPHHFRPEEVETLRAMAAQISLAAETTDLYAKALAASRLKSEFLATMSHELRTPLNAIMGYTEMILAGTYGPVEDRLRDRLGRVYDNAQHLLRLINDVLDLAKIESGRITLAIEPVAIAPLVDSALLYVLPTAEGKSLTFQVDLAPDLPDVIGDGMRLRQVLINLLSNAVKFTREGGVTVRAATFSVPTRDPSLNIPEGIGLEDGLWMAIAVEDTGIGIAREDHEIIFDAFRQLDGSVSREYPGTGLGLAISRQLVEMHNGRMWVRSVLGAGSTFTFALPVHPAVTDRMLGQSN